MKPDIEININEIRNAKYEEREEILSFYRCFIGINGCTWTFDYPNYVEIDYDIKHRNLYLMKDEKGIIATISLDDDPIVEKLDVWKLSNAKEIARLGVRKDYQNKGIAKQMIRFAMKEITKRGYQGVRYLVSPHNPIALRAYEKLEFTKAGEIDLYDEHWYCYENVL